MSQKLSVGGFEQKRNTLKFNEDFIKSYDEDRNIGYILEVNVEYPKSLIDLHCDLPFLPKRIQIKKCSQLFCNLDDKNNYVVHIKALK